MKATEEALFAGISKMRAGNVLDDISGAIEDVALSWTVSKNKWYLTSNMRVGYVWDALYSFNPLFADFIYPNNTTSAIQFN